MTNSTPLASLVETHATVMGRLFAHFSSHASSTGTRVLLIVALAVLVHLTVRAIRSLSEWLINRSRARKSPLDFVTQQPKFITLIQLVANGVTFVMYFFAMGLVLEEFGVNLTGYLASASIIALAISFGSQGLVQDVVIGLTLIFSDAMDVGDMVEIAGTTIVIGPRGGNRPAVHHAPQFLQPAGVHPQPHHRQRQPVSARRGVCVCGRPDSGGRGPGQRPSRPSKTSPRGCGCNSAR